MHFILVNFRLLIFGESTDACEYTVHVQCSPLICQYTKSWVDAGEAATVAPYAEVGRRRHQCGLQLWHNAKSSDDDIIIAARRRKRAERLFIFIFQSEPVSDTRHQVNLRQLNLHLSNDVAAPERGRVVFH